MWHISELHVQNFYLLFVCHEREENCASVTIESSIADADALIFFLHLFRSQPARLQTHIYAHILRNLLPTQHRFKAYQRQ